MREKYQQAIDAISSEFGITGKLGSMTYDSQSVSVKLSFSIPKDNPTPIIVGNEGALIGKSYRSRNSVYTIISQEYGKVKARNQKGKIYNIKTLQLKDMVEI